MEAEEANEEGEGGCVEGDMGSDCASQAEGADIISERQASRRGGESNERQRVEDKTTEGKQLLMFFKNKLTFTCFPRVQPGQSSAKGQQPSICAAGMPHVCRSRAIFIRAQKNQPSQCDAPINGGARTAVVVCQREVGKNPSPIAFFFNLIVLQR